MSKYPSQTQDKFTVRFPDGMRDAIAKRAEANGRSMNSEILQILQDALDGTEANTSNFIQLDNSGLAPLNENISPKELIKLLSALASAEPALRLLSDDLLIKATEYIKNDKQK
ncbi:Arc family DNA-binding protein [Providencia stuartii]|uniref:Arc family DNA-binding protein n=1 Tax=Providencia stuartii TaxID=588 RepID=UPI0034D74C73